jgi:hypothetical protein
VLGAISAGTVACGSSGDVGTSTDSARTCSADVTPASDLASPVVTFETDVAPIFAKACAFSSCHGSHTVTANHGVFLGAAGADGMSAVKTSLESASHALPSMKYVVPGDVANSFVLHKLDGSLCGLDAQCVGGSCGKSMPEGNDLLPQASRDTVRRWIAQGAK